MRGGATGGPRGRRGGAGRRGTCGAWEQILVAGLGALLAGTAAQMPVTGGLASDLSCERGCVSVEVANLVWCVEAVDYVFCNRTASGPRDSSVMKHEQTAINAYLAMMQQMGPKAKESKDCKKAVRRWMCYELFPRCTADELRVYPVCQSSCLNVFNACGKPFWLNCFLEVQEEFGLQTSVAENGSVIQHYNAEGEYVRGSGTPVFEAKSNKCTGAAERARPAAAAFALVLALAAAAGLALAGP